MITTFERLIYKPLFLTIKPNKSEKITTLNQSQSPPQKPLLRDL